MGSFNNYVDQILSNIDPFPPWVDNLDNINPLSSPSLDFVLPLSPPPSYCSRSYQMNPIKLLKHADYVAYFCRHPNFTWNQSKSLKRNSAKSKCTYAKSMQKGSMYRASKKKYLQLNLVIRSFLVTLKLFLNAGQLGICFENLGNFWRFWVTVLIIC